MMKEVWKSDLIMAKQRKTSFEMDGWMDDVVADLKVMKIKQ
jgi:hypothetical protein